MHDRDPGGLVARARASPGRTASRRSRRGIVESLRAEPYSNGTILPREHTHRGPIEGRLALLRATRTQLDSIFLLYEGAAPIEGAPPRPPDLEVGGWRLWPSRAIKCRRPLFAGRQLLIADGHHRYETAVEFAAEDGADRMLAVLVSTADPGLVPIPTHRVFADRPDVRRRPLERLSVEDAVDALDHRTGRPCCRRARPSGPAC